MANNENSLVEFKSSSIHGTGAFARTSIPSGTRLVQYVGRRITKEESLRQCELENPYIFTLDDTWDLDGNVDWNPARWINHSCNPNAEARQESDSIWIYSLNPIAEGEEITFNYNYDLVDYKEHPCRCGAHNCVGFMVAEDCFSEIKRLTGKD